MLSDLAKVSGLLPIDSHAEWRELICITPALLAPPHDFDFTFHQKYRREKFSLKRFIMIIRHLINDTYQVWNSTETTCWHQGSLASCMAYKQWND